MGNDKYKDTNTNTSARGRKKNWTPTKATGHPCWGQNQHAHCTHTCLYVNLRIHGYMGGQSWIHKHKYFCLAWRKTGLLAPNQHWLVTLGFTEFAFTSEWKKGWCQNFQNSYKLHHFINQRGQDLSVKGCVKVTDMVRYREPVDCMI